MTKTPNETKLLSPPTGVRIAWALTGAFVNNPDSMDIASMARKDLDDLREKTAKGKSPELDYVSSAVTVIQATMRTLDTIYKGRELNFKENDLLRSANWDNIKGDLQFGNSAKDFMKSLPTMTVTSSAGVITLGQIVSWPSWALWLLGLGLAGVGYFINLRIVKRASRSKQKLLLEQDYERNMYYEQYIYRVRTSLINLYADIDRLHKKAFGKHYQLEKSEDVFRVVDGILKGAMPTMCAQVSKHMKDGRITPELWARCESGGKAAEECEHWGK